MNAEQQQQIERMAQRMIDNDNYLLSLIPTLPAAERKEYSERVTESIEGSGLILKSINQLSNIQLCNSKKRQERKQNSA